MLDHSEIEALLRKAESAVASTKTIADLEQTKSNFLGRKGFVTALFKELSRLPDTKRPEAGEHINQAKLAIQGYLDKQKELLREKAITEKLASEWMDVTLPSRGLQCGGLHPVTLCLQRIHAFFSPMGFKTVDGPEIEDDYHNFEALNIPASHPARAAHDTFYFSNGMLLRTHTSSVQIRTMKQSSPPFQFIASGRVYRRDSDLTHTPMFHQVEVVFVDEGVSFSHLKWLLQSFLDYFFGKTMKTRFRASYFPFTEPSAEVDIRGADKWLEILGCGMIHPAVLGNLGIDPKRYSGFAFGMGVERLAMLRYQIPDLRILFENDTRLLQQFR